MSLLKSNSVQIGQSATATQNFTLSVPSSPDGTIKLARGNSGATTQDVLTVNSSGVVSFPNNSVAYSPNPFFFFKSVNQTVVTNTATKCTFDSTLFNVNSKITLASSTFTPTLAGYYRIFAQIHAVNGGSGAGSAIAIYKNGSATNGIHGQVSVNGAASGSTTMFMVNGIMSFNGSTDTFEIYGSTYATSWQTGSGTANQAIPNLTYATFVQGFYLGA